MRCSGSGARCYFGQGVLQDYTIALTWYEHAAEHGAVWAQFRLGDMYYFGQGVPKDYAEAEKWLRRAAVQGEALAQLGLGLMYETGQGVPKDYAKALTWYRRTAEQGNAVAGSFLGEMYETGHGVPQDFTEALKWYRRAAGQGNAVAQYNLGRLYVNGKGVRQDFPEAARWYARSAKQGFAAAQAALGSMYTLGMGVPIDYVKAYTWLNLAAAQNNGTARRLLADLALSMTPEQIAEAQRVSSLFVPHTEKGASSGAVIAATTPPVTPGSSAAALTAQVQRELRALGYNPGPVDGVAGAMTTAAVRAFQRDHHIGPDGVISTALLALLESATRPATSTAPPAAALAATGTGFVIDHRGDVVTNHHVIAGCKRVRVVFASGTEDATVTADSPEDDIALLRPGKGSSSGIASLQRERQAVLGEDVVVAGYPLRGLLAAGLNVAAGNVSALAGVDNDRRLLQITAPVQPGNSGGPLLDKSGEVIGVVVGKLNAITVAKATGDIPQNVNFAIKGAVLRSFLDINGIDYAVDQSKTVLDNTGIAAKARTFTFPVECWK